MLAGCTPYYVLTLLVSPVTVINNWICGHDPVEAVMFLGAMATSQQLPRRVTAAGYHGRAAPDVVEDMALLTLSMMRKPEPQSSSPEAEQEAEGESAELRQRVKDAIAASDKPCPRPDTNLSVAAPPSPCRPFATTYLGEACHNGPDHNSNPDTRGLRAEPWTPGGQLFQQFVFSD